MPRTQMRTSRLRPGGFDFKKELGGYEPPSFPRLIGDALILLAEPDVNMSMVSSLLELDPGLSAQMLKFVNSAAVAPRTRIGSVHQATMMLGRGQLEALLISAGARAALPRATGPSFDHGRFWKTAGKRAALAGAIAARIDPTTRSENFTAALLQDMAVPVLIQKASPYNLLLEHWHNGTEDLANLEVNIFGWHHGDVAGWMGETWGFPEHFVQFMSDHHSHVDNHLMPAHLVAPIREVTADGEDEVVETTSSVLGISADDVVVMVEEAELQASDLAELVG